MGVARGRRDGLEGGPVVLGRDGPQGLQVLDAAHVRREELGDAARGRVEHLGGRQPALDERHPKRSQRVTEIEGAKFQVQKAARNFERSKHLFQGKLISVEVFEDTKTEFDMASNALQRAERASGTARRSALTQLAGQLDRDAAGAGDAAKVRLLAAAVTDLANADH